MDAPTRLPDAVVTDAAASPGDGVALTVRRLPPPALKVRAYRWYWLAQWPVLIGMWMQIVALGYLVFSVTGSARAVSLVAAAQGFPAVALSVLGGALADRLARGRLLLVPPS